jgi:hypothetical protein
VSWIAIIAGASGSGTGVVTLAVAPNTGVSTRSENISVGGQTVTIEQTAPAVTEPEIVFSSDDAAFAIEVLARLLGRTPRVAEAATFVEASRARGRANAFAEALASPHFSASSRFVAGLYVGLLNRDPEFSGWSFQLQALLSTATTQEELVRNFLESPEFKLKYSGQAREAFIRMLYRQVLFREVAPSELSFHADTLASLSRTQVAKNFLNSAEFRLGAEHRVTVFLVYACLRGSDASQAELIRQVEELRQGKQLSQLVTELLPSR